MKISIISIFTVLCLNALSSNEIVNEKKLSGEKIFQNRCQNCHELPYRDSLSKTQWHFVLKTMQRRMKSSNLPPLSETETSVLYQWLTAKQD